MLPEGILDYFDITSVDKEDNGLLISLEEKNIPPMEYASEKLLSKGFYAPSTIQDFPIRGKACYFSIKRRRWTIESSGKIVSRNWDLVAKGTRMTQQFASFLKGAD